jgi:hypothetical protein
MATLMKLFLILLVILPNLFLEAKNPATCGLYSMKGEDKHILYNNLKKRTNSKIILFFKEKGGLNLSVSDFDVYIRNHIEVGPGSYEGGSYDGNWEATDINFIFNSQDGDKFRSFLEGCEDQIDHSCHFGRNRLVFQDQMERDWRGKVTSRKCLITGSGEFGIGGIKMGIVNTTQQNYRLGDLIIYEAGEEIMSFPLDLPAPLSTDENYLP